MSRAHRRRLARSNRVRRLYAWDLCIMCGAFVRCPSCGMNSCSGGYGRTDDGKDCPDCPRAYHVMHRAIRHGLVPRLPGDSREERSARLVLARAQAVADGVQFGTIEDLLSI